MAPQEWSQTGRKRWAHLTSPTETIPTILCCNQQPWYRMKRQASSWLWRRTLGFTTTRETRHSKRHKSSALGLLVMAAWAKNLMQLATTHLNRHLSDRSSKARSTHRRSTKKLVLLLITWSRLMTNNTHSSQIQGWPISFLMTSEDRSKVWNYKLVAKASVALASQTTQVALSLKALCGLQSTGHRWASSIPTLTSMQTPRI